MKLLFLGISIALLFGCTKKESEIQRKMTCKDGVLVDAGIVGGKPVKDADYLEKQLSSGTLFVISKSASSDAKESEDEFSVCTASLIDDNIALTAAHCVADTNVKNPKTLQVAFSLDPVCDAMATSGSEVLRPGSAIIKHEKYDLNSDNLSQYDLALIRFEGKAPEGKVPMKLLMSEVELNSQSEIIVTGYGKTTDYNLPDESGSILRYAKIAPLLISKNNDKITKTNKNEVLYFDQSNNQAACSGDSGGPTLLKKNEDLYVIGVNSAVDTIDDNGFKKQSEVTCSLSLRSTSVLANKEWILQNHKKLLNSSSRDILSR